MGKHRSHRMHSGWPESMIWWDAHKEECKWLLESFCFMAIIAFVLVLILN